jgi:hypothetical protein
MNEIKVKPEDLKGMTVNERLFACDLFEVWEKAVNNRDRENMISVLLEAQLTNEQAIETVDTVLKNPKYYGF